MYESFIKTILINMITVITLNGIFSVACNAAFEDLLDEENQIRFRRFSSQQQQLIKSRVHQQSEEITNETFIGIRWISEDTKRIAYNKVSNGIIGACMYDIVEHPEMDSKWRRAFRRHCTLIMDTIENEINIPQEIIQQVELAPTRYPAMVIQPALPKIGIEKQQNIGNNTDDLLVKGISIPPPQGTDLITPELVLPWPQEKKKINRENNAFYDPPNAPYTHGRTTGKK